MAANGSTTTPKTTEKDNDQNVIPFSVQNDPEKGCVVPTSDQPKQNNANIGKDTTNMRCLCGCFHNKIDEDTENELVSQAGDIGDRELNSRGGSSRRTSDRFSTETRAQGTVSPVAEELLELYSFWSHHDPAKLTAVFGGSPPLTSKLALPITDPNLHKNNQEEEKGGLPPWLEYSACMVYLAIFSIFGVISRFLLEKLFSSSILGVTSDDGILFLDLPPDIVGCFMMGWLGIVFRGDIARVSDQLAIGLTSGYLGSLSAYWNLKMLELSVRGHWLFVFLSFLIGLLLCASSFIFGVETAKGFRHLLKRIGIDLSGNKPIRNSVKHHLIVVVTLIFMWGGLWIAMGFIEEKEFKIGGTNAKLWLACFLSPFGVWVRWLLARLNGHGLGKTGQLKWIPFGTLIANISAASMMAALAVMKKAVDTQDADTIITSIQFGFLGCLSTVPAFISEFHAMRGSSHPWRAYAYLTITVGSTFGLGTLIYSVCVWTKAF